MARQPRGWPSRADNSPPANTLSSGFFSAGTLRSPPGKAKGLCRFGVGFEEIGELLLQLSELGGNRHLAVRLVGIFGKVLPVVVLGVVEVAEPLHRGDDG